MIVMRGIEALAAPQVILLARLINDHKSLFQRREDLRSAPLPLRRKRPSKEDRISREHSGIKPPTPYRKAGIQKYSPRSPRTIARKSNADKMGLLYSKHSPTFKQRSPYCLQVRCKHQMSAHIHH